MTYPAAGGSLKSTPTPEGGVLMVDKTHPYRPPEPHGAMALVEARRLIDAAIRVLCQEGQEDRVTSDRYGFCLIIEQLDHLIARWEAMLARNPEDCRGLGCAIVGVRNLCLALLPENERGQ